VAALPAGRLSRSLTSQVTISDWSIGRVSVLWVSPRTGPVRQAIPEAGEILGARVGDTCLGVQPVTQQRPGGTNRVADIVALMDIGEHGDDLQRFVVQQAARQPTGLAP
jgi:hypothetical protein